MARRRREHRDCSRARARWGRRLFVGLLVALLATPVLTAWLILEKSPLVLSLDAPDPRDAQRGKAVTKRAIKEVLSGRSSATLRFTEAELNSVIALVAHGVPNLTARVNVANFGLEGALSYRLPDGLPTRFVNVRTGLEPSARSLRISRLEIGQITIPGGATLAILRIVGDLVLGDGLGTALVKGVQSVEFAPGELTARMTLAPDLRMRMSEARSRLKEVRDQVALLGDPAVIARYYERIAVTDARTPSHARISLAAFLTPVFDLAVERSRDGDAVTENRAALLALAIYLGDGRFERLTGPVRSTAQAERKRARVVLVGRKDLRLHFLISAGLKVVTDSDIPFAIGEFKELLDSGRGGSGFSFTDLAADRAGVRFATAATDPETARSLQAKLAKAPDEGRFFPVVSDLPESLPESVFMSRYGGIDGAGYIELLERIDARIDALDAYRP